MEMKVYLETPTDVKRFTAVAGAIPSDIQTKVKSGCYEVDAKSLMGIFSLDLSKDVTLEILTDNLKYDMCDIADKFKAWVV